MSAAEHAHPLPEPEATPPMVAAVGRWMGPALGAALVAMTHPAVGGVGGIGADAAWTLGLLAWMATWWMTQAVEMAVTALLPVIVLPLLGIGSFRVVGGNYADQVIFLFAGGTTLGWALERHGLSARFAAGLLRVAGRSPAATVAALFTASAVISAFVSNMATTAALLPLAAGVASTAVARPGASPAAAARGARHLTTATMLAVAYGSSIGGAATIIGSPPNPIAAQYLAERGEPIDFTGWLVIGVPAAVIMGASTVVVLLRMLPVRDVVLRGGTTDGAAPPLTAAAWSTAAVFTAAVLAWTTSKAWPPAWRPDGLTDGGIAITAAAVLFLLPARDGTGARVVPWSAVRDLPWGVFVLFGGGLALADAMQRTGLSDAIGNAFAGLEGLPAVLAVATVVTAMVFASEIASNTALAATAVPIVGALAPALGLPLRPAVMAATLGASLAFMLPVGTPPNALVFATGQVPARAMLRVGFVLNLVSVAVITAVIMLLA